MRFMGLLRADEDFAVARFSQQLLENMETCMEQASQAGILLAFGGLQPSPLGARVKLFAGKVTVTDCPLTEIKSRTIPCAMFEVDSIMEAVQWTACFLQVLGAGECDIRPLYEDFGETLTPELKAQQDRLRAETEGRQKFSNIFPTAVD